MFLFKTAWLRFIKRLSLISSKFWLFDSSIYNLDSILNENLDFAKTKIEDAALISFRNHNANVPCNLLDEEFKALQNLSKNTNLLIQKPDKGI